MQNSKLFTRKDVRFVVRNSEPSEHESQTTVAVLDKYNARDMTSVSPDSSDSQQPGDSSLLGVAGWGVLVGLCWLATMIVSVDRTAMSIAIIPMSKELGWDESTKGLVNSLFLLGQMMSNLIAGPLGTRIGQTRLLCGGLLLWSSATALTPLAAFNSFSTLLVARLGLGLGEGVAFPCILSLFRERVPLNQRTRMTGLIYSGINFGTVVSLTTAPFIINYLGWPGVFETYGSLGFLWAPVWLSLIPAVVSQSNFLKTSDTDTDSNSIAKFQVERSSDEEERVAGWQELLQNKAVWAIIISQGSWACGFYTTMAWLPTYFNQEFGVDVKSSALLTLLPVVLKFCSTNFSGWLFDTLVNRNLLSRTRGRKIFSGIANLGPASLFLTLGLVTANCPDLDLKTAVTLVCLSQFPKGFCAGGFASNHADLGKKSVGTIFGVASAFASLAGSGAVYLTGAALDHYGSWSVVFEGLAVTYFIGALVYTKYGSAEQQFN